MTTFADKELFVLLLAMAQHVNVRLGCLEIHSLVVFVLQISVQQVIRVPIVKCALVDVVSIVVKMLCVA